MCRGASSGENPWPHSIRADKSRTPVVQRENGFRHENRLGGEIRDFISTSDSLGAKGVCAARKRHPRPIRNPVFACPERPGAIVGDVIENRDGRVVPGERDSRQKMPLQILPTGFECCAKIHRIKHEFLPIQSVRR